MSQEQQQQQELQEKKLGGKKNSIEMNAKHHKNECNKRK